jgi:hypothetical protein
MKVRSFRSEWRASGTESARAFQNCRGCHERQFMGGVAASQCNSEDECRPA